MKNLNNLNTPKNQVFNSIPGSSVSPDRVNHLNYLAELAFRQERRDAAEAVDEHDLIIESYGMEDVLDQLIDLGTYENFYTDVNEAFKVAMSAHPDQSKSLFDSYVTLSSLFRVIESQRELIGTKLQEYRHVINDINVLDREDIERRKGGCSND